MKQPNDAPHRKPEKFPDWETVRIILSGLAFVVLVGVILATLTGLLDTPTERRLRNRLDAYEQQQNEILRRHQQETRDAEEKLKVLEREIFGPGRK